jgi:hypothetical protein
VFEEFEYEIDNNFEIRGGELLWKSTFF